MQPSSHVAAAGTFSNQSAGLICAIASSRRHARLGRTSNREEQMISARVLLRVTLIGLLGSLSIAPNAFAQGKWERKAAFPDPSEEVLGMAAGGKMYVFAGLAPVWKPKALVFEYDPAADKWSERKKMALPS